MVCVLGSIPHTAQLQITYTSSKVRFVTISILLISFNGKKWDKKWKKQIDNLDGREWKGDDSCQKKKQLNEMKTDWKTNLSYSLLINI